MSADWWQHDKDHEEWLADRAAQAEYQSWLDLIDSTLRTQSWDAIQQTQAGETFNKLRQDRTSQGAFD